MFPPGSKDLFDGGMIRSSGSPRVTNHQNRQAGTTPITPMTRACQDGIPRRSPNRKPFTRPPPGFDRGLGRAPTGTAELAVSVMARSLTGQFAFSAVSTLISTRRFLVWLSGSTGRSHPTPSTLNRFAIEIGVLLEQSFLDGVGPLERKVFDGLDRHLALHRAVGMAFDDDPRAAELTGQLRDLFQNVLDVRGRSAPRLLCRSRPD